MNNDFDLRVAIWMATAKDGNRALVALQEADVSACVCLNLNELCEALRAGAGAILLTEELLASDQEGLIHQLLDAQPAWSDIPFVVIAHSEAASAGIRETLNAVLVERPIRTRTLLSAVRSALRSRRQQYAVRQFIEERNRVQAAHQYLIRLHDAIRSLSDTTEIQCAACRVLGEHLNANRVAYIQFEADENAVVNDFHRDAVSIAGRYPASTLKQTLVDCSQQRTTFAEADAMARDDRPAAEREAFASLGVKGHVDVPFLHEGTLVGCMTVHFTAAHQWQAEELSLIEETAERTRSAVMKSMAEQTLQEVDRKKDDFIALLAHELRNPLAPIRNGLQILKLGGLDEAALDMMDRQLSHMVRLVDDLLDISRIGRNKIKLNLECVDLTRVITSAIETANPLIAAASHKLQIEFPPQPVYVSADTTRLAQVFANLLTNAAKYTPPGGSIRIRVIPGDNDVTIEVRDNGIGIPATELGAVFEMFSQVDRSIERSSGGLGIGLALVKALTEMHNGTVAVNSGETGSVFSVKLPTCPTGSPTKPDALNANSATEPGLRVVVVDDNRDSADTLSLLLRMLGLQVATAHDGVEAVTTVQEFRPQLVLMDIGMPKLNGYDATREIRRHEWGKSVSIFALSGWGQEHDRKLSMDAGCDGHLVKPVNLSELRSVLSQLHPSEQSELVGESDIT